MKRILNSKKNLTLTVGIATNYGGESLLAAAKSIRSSKDIKGFRFIIVADTIPIPIHILQQLKKLKIDVIQNRKSGSQFKKLKQIIALCKSDICIFTQDDVVFEKNAISKIIRVFIEDSSVDMVSPHIKSAPSISLLDKIIAVGVNLVYGIGVKWNKSDNYLLANGRCLAFKTNFLKKFNIPEKVVNGDAYLYFENKRLNGVFEHATKAIVYNPNPTNLKDYFNQTGRFKTSYKELSKFFKLDIYQYYKVPKFAVINSFWTESIKNPIFMLLYLPLFVLSRIKKTNKKISLNTNWEVAASTKERF